MWGISPYNLYGPYGLTLLLLAALGNFCSPVVVLTLTSLEQEVHCIWFIAKKNFPQYGLNLFGSNSELEKILLVFPFFPVNCGMISTTSMLLKNFSISRNICSKKISASSKKCLLALLER